MVDTEALFKSKAYAFLRLLKMVHDNWELFYSLLMSLFLDSRKVSLSKTEWGIVDLLFFL